MEAVKELGVLRRGRHPRLRDRRFNDYCRTSVLRYTGEWERYVTRQARWVDFANDYKTMDLSYMESVMWAFKQLHEKGLLYEGYRVLPVLLGVRDAPVQLRDPPGQCLPVAPGPGRHGRFRAGAAGRRGPAAALFDAGLPVRALVWTTTPWTLPSNLALAVGADITYAVLQANDARYLVAEARLAALADVLDAALPERGSWPP